MRLRDVYEEDGWGIRRDPEVISHLQMLLAHTADLRERKTSNGYVQSVATRSVTEISR